jgi:hypothetical protein
MTLILCGAHERARRTLKRSIEIRFRYHNASAPKNSADDVMDRVAEWIAAAGMIAAATAVTLWMAGAIGYDVFNGGRRGLLAATAWIVGVAALLTLWQPLWQPFLALLGFTALFLLWWFRQKPSHDRDWDPSVAVLPRAIRIDDTVTIENLRNFDYRSLEDFIPRYENRTYDLKNLASADVIFFNWGSAVMSHPLVVFDFGSDGRVCISIEVRYQRGQKYSILRSLYHFYEIIFLVSDERDAILRRTKYGPAQQAHLYRVTATPEELRATFLDYVDSIAAIYAAPRWYHGLCTNCTTTFYRLPSQGWTWDWRVLANAQLDRSLYSRKRLDQSLPFAELRRSAYLNDIANIAPAEGFGDYIRRELERRRHDR